ncbi:hypothetical protein E2C01_016909 [Portunus trituberculatus]|uniref:Uncharacterized protein n=1 Tax=Portunus trituberculatus TaxID=210409 RepID=A0A5B7DQB6_PORTR|nr:hypothetical protein [Portunus trituberculatus]
MMPCRSDAITAALLTLGRGMRGGSLEPAGEYDETVRRRTGICDVTTQLRTHPGKGHPGRLLAAAVPNPRQAHSTRQTHYNSNY